MEIRNVLIVGTGTLGSQIGFQCALHGFKTTLVDIDTAALETCEARHQKIAEAVKASLGESDERINAAHNRLSYTTDLAAAASDADLVSESVPENPVLKRQVFAQLNEICPPHAIFTTNSSSLLPSDIADASGRPERFLALHFANRIWVNNIAEVMKHPGTDAAVFKRVVQFAAEIGMVPIRIEKENNGYVLNALLMPLLTAAQTLVSNGIATHEDVDRTWMITMHTESGPFGTLDIIGLQTVYTISDYWANRSGDQQLRKNADYLKAHYLDQGKLGAGSREGFYQYPNPTYQRPDFLT